MSSVGRFLANVAGATALVVCAAVPLSGAQAATIDWTNWSSNSAGTMGGINVTYSGELQGLVGTGYYNPGVSSYDPYTCCNTLWFPPSTFADGSIVANAPPTAYDAIKLIGGGNFTDTITFSTPVTNPVVAIWSLGSSGTAAFDFNPSLPSLVISGPTAINALYGGTGLLTVLGSTVSGAEGNGTIQFLGTYSSISFTSSFEDFYGFTVGTPTPLPSTWLMLLTGFVGLGFFAYRGTQKQAAALAAA